MADEAAIHVGREMNAGYDRVERQHEFRPRPWREYRRVVTDREPHVGAHRAAAGKIALDQLELTWRHAGKPLIRPRDSGDLAPLHGAMHP